VVGAGEVGPLKAEYLDVIVSDVRTTNGLAFSVQILNTEGACARVRLSRC
jgi:staphylococcal nuclease domain-containing protein 1